MPCVAINVVPPKEEEKPPAGTEDLGILGILFIILAIAIAIYIRRR